MAWKERSTFQVDLVHNCSAAIKFTHGYATSLGSDNYNDAYYTNHKASEKGCDRQDIVRHSYTTSRKGWLTVPQAQT